MTRLERKLNRAIKKGKTELVKKLIQNKTNLNVHNRKGKTFLMIASEKGNNTIIKEFLKTNADLNIQDKYGKTAIAYAAENGHNSILKLLLKAGADINIESPRCTTPLHLATEKGNTAIVRTLLTAGAEVNANYNGTYTPLYTAALKGYTDIARILIKAGADVYAKSNSGKTAMYIAKSQGNASIVNLLNKAHGHIDKLVNLVLSDHIDDSTNPWTKTSDIAWEKLGKLNNKEMAIKPLMEKFNNQNQKTMGLKLCAFLGNINSEASNSALLEIIKYGLRSSDHWENRYLVKHACTNLLKIQDGISKLRSKVPIDLFQSILYRSLMDPDNKPRVSSFR